MTTDLHPMVNKEDDEYTYGGSGTQYGSSNHDTHDGRYSERETDSERQRQEDQGTTHQ